MVTITIILPVYNSIKYIKDCLNSISEQTFKDWKLLIFDDSSNDGTLEYLENWIKKESRATLFKRNQSYIQNLNEGIDITDTKYIARMDADDIMFPNRLQYQLDFMESHPDIDLISSSVEIIDEKNNHKGYFSSFFPNQTLDASDMAFMNQIVHPSVFIRKESLDKNNIRYKKEFKYAEDWEMWTQMLEYNMKLFNTSTPLIKYRVVNNSMSRTHQDEIKVLRKKILQRLFKIISHE